MASNVTTIIDRSEEKTVHTLGSTTLTAANFDAEAAKRATYKSALEAIVLGTIEKLTVSQTTAYSTTLPASPYANRETKLLVRYTNDSTGSFYTLEIGTPDLASLTFEGNTDFILLADGGIMAAWVTAFEDLARAPDNVTQTVTVVSAQLIGRNI